MDKGLEIIEGLRGHTTGYAVPTYVIDAPGGGGKIPLIPDYVVGREGDDLLLRNFEGGRYRYPDPDGTLGLGRRQRTTTDRRLGDTRCAIGLTYDLRDEYLAAGYGERRRPSSISPRPSTRSSRRAGALGLAVDRIGHVRSWPQRLVAGERWDLVFNIAEGLHGVGREAQVPALLDAYESPTPSPIRWSWR